MTLQQDNASQFFGKSSSRRHAVFPDDAAQPGKFPVVGRQNGGQFPSAQ